MIPVEAAEAARYSYGVFFDMFPDWYKRRCIKQFMQSETYEHRETT